MNQNKTIKQKKQSSIYMFIIPAIIFFMTLCNQGGYYNGGIVFCGLIQAGSLMFVLYKSEKKYILLLIFAGWFFLCSVKDGFVIEYAIRGLIPAVSLLFLFLISYICKAELVSAILKLSAVIALFAIISCAVLSMQSSKLYRLLLPFNYSNACGIYFGISYILCIDSKDDFLKKARYVFLAATILTQSVGAIGITIVGVILYRKNLKHTIIVILVCLVGAFFAKNRITESYATFIERLLQMHDGILCIVKNPIFGIGAGKWENAKHYFQTGYYKATVIHSSILQIGVDAGISGIILFFVSLKFILKEAKKNMKYFLTAVLLLAHSFFDFSLSFLALDMFLALLVSGDNNKEEHLKKQTCIKKALVYMCFIIFALSGISLAVIRTFNVNSGISSTISIIDSYEKNIILNHSEKTKEKYIYTLYKRGEIRKLQNIIDREKYPSQEMILIDIASEKPESGKLRKYLTLQPFNTSLQHIADEEKYTKAAEKQM